MINPDTQSPRPIKLAILAGSVYDETYSIWRAQIASPTHAGASMFCWRTSLGGSMA